MKLRQAFASKNFAGTSALTVALLATFGACSVDTDGIEFIPDDEFNKGAGASGGSGNNNNNTGGEGGSPSDDESCEPGERRCSNEGLLQTCVEGDPPTWRTDKDCKGPGRCSVLRDKCLECAPGEYRCKDADLEQCDMAGERFERVQTCADADACSAKGQVGYCIVCEPGETYCEGEGILDSGSGDDVESVINQVRTCASGGGYTELNANCQGNEPLCNLERKSCGTCITGTYSCQGTDLYKCNKEGYLEYVERCDSAAACKEDAGECDNTGIECVPGQDGPRCEGNTLQTCRADGKYHDEKVCGDGMCRDGYPDCLPCNIDAFLECSGNTIVSCRPTPWDSWYTPVQFGQCQSGCTPNSDSCVGGCVIPSVRCAPGNNFYEVCTSSGGGVNEYQSVPCAADQVCYGASCVDCYPGAYSCEGNSLVRCSADGSSKTLVENCSVTNTSCDARLGKCVPYGGPGRYFCNADGDYAYMNVDGNVQIEQYCDNRACDWSSGCYGFSSSCRDGMIACEGRRVRVCDNGYYEKSDTTCSNNTTCQPTIGCTVPVAIAAGYNHTCAILAEPGHTDGIGYAVCWGDNSFGQLGNGVTAENGGFGDSVDPRRVLLTFKDDDEGETGINGYSVAVFSHISAGRDFTCADIQPPGSTGEYWVMCWGSNEFGQIGSDNPDPGPFNGPAMPFFVFPDTGGNPDDTEPLRLRYVSAGEQFACALAPNGAAWCWGRNDAGQLGVDSDDEYRPYASEVKGGHSFVEIAAGARHACAVTIDGSVYCWGDNTLGQLGLGKDKIVRVPTKVGDLSVSSAGDAFPALGRDFSAILAADESNPRSWGANTFGQLGDGGTKGRNAPGAMSSVRSSDARSLFSSSTAQHQCLRDKNDKLFCVGANVFGQLGDKSTLDRTKFVQVWDGGSDARTLSPVRDAVAVGGRHTCAINALNEIWCWGANHRHQLGSTKATPQTTPSKVF
jgi:alpha-tubulin suppressor-like RCC1 family protein